MSFTYTPGNAGNRDKLRLIIGDTGADDYIFENEELDLFLSMEESDLYRSAAMACRSIATNRAKQAIAVRIMGDVSIDKTKIPRFYFDLADKYEKKELLEPIVYTDSFMYEVDQHGVDKSERVGDDEFF
jgi:hypothetical protein